MAPKRQRSIADIEKSSSSSKKSKAQETIPLNYSESDPNFMKSCAYSPIESLPLEVLEQIFLEYGSTSLPLASPLIGSALSSSWVLAQYSKRFCESMTIKELNDILRRRFCTLEWFLKSFDDGRMQQGFLQPDPDPDCQDVDGTILQPPYRWFVDPNKSWDQDICDAWSMLQSIASSSGFIPHGRTYSLYSTLSETAIQYAIHRRDIRCVHLLTIPLCRRNIKKYCTSVGNGGERRTRKTNRRMENKRPKPKEEETIQYALPLSFLRMTVVDYGCDKLTVLMLLTAYLSWVIPKAGNYSSLARTLTEMIDIWFWIEANGDHGEWLKRLLRILIDFLECEEESIRTRSSHQTNVFHWCQVAAQAWYQMQQQQEISETAYEPRFSRYLHACYREECRGLSGSRKYFENKEFLQDQHDAGHNEYAD